MGIGAGILIAAIGAVLAFAVNADIDGIELDTIGTIMMIAGVVIALIAAAATASRRSRYAAADPVVADRRVVVDERPPDTRI
ncbi:MAG: hypothetical protein H0V33_06780 [Acidimicrobiia bacterium]|jgi:riboflavin transporter FmnP|nr:hypothetical protein [Acidimicrobiia bacterium]